MLTNVKFRLRAIAIAAFALLALGAVFAGAAGASDSGGVSTMTSGGTGSTSGGDSEANARLNDRYTRIWESQITAPEKRWAHRTSDCESGSDPHAIGGGGAYRGAFQFTRSTWNASPRSPGGDPVAYPYRTQAVVAVLLKRRDGAGHWPVCGR